MADEGGGVEIRRVSYHACVRLNAGNEIYGLCVGKMEEPRLTRDSYIKIGEMIQESLRQLRGVCVAMYMDLSTRNQCDPSNKLAALIGAVV